MGRILWSGRRNQDNYSLFNGTRRLWKPWRQTRTQKQASQRLYGSRKHFSKFVLMNLNFRFGSTLMSQLLDNLHVQESTIVLTGITILSRLWLSATVQWQSLGPPTTIFFTITANNLQSGHDMDDTSRIRYAFWRLLKVFFIFRALLLLPELWPQRQYYLPDLHQQRLASVWQFTRASKLVAKSCTGTSLLASSDLHVYTTEILVQ